MLILTRKVGESIMIGESVEVKVLGIRAGQIKIGIEAPKETAVVREELAEQLRRADMLAIETAQQGQLGSDAS